MAEKAGSESRPPQPAKKAPAELPETEVAAPLRPTPPLRLTYDTPEETERVWAQYERDQVAWKQREDAWRLQYWQRYDKARAERQAKDQEAARSLAERLAKDREAAKDLPAEFLLALPLPPRWLAATRAEKERDQREYDHKLAAWERECQMLLRQRELERQIEASAARAVRVVEEAQAERQARDQEAAKALAERLAKDREAEHERQIEASAARAVRAVAEKLLGQEPPAPAPAQTTPPVRGGRKPYPQHKRDALVSEYEKRLARGENQRHAADMTARQAKPKVHPDTIRRWHREKGQMGQN